MHTSSWISKTTYLAILSVIVVTLLVIGKSLLIPLTLGLFLSLTLSPWVDRMIRWKFPKTLAIIIGFLGTFVVLGVISVTIGFAVNDFVGKIPEYSQSVDTNISATKDFITNILPFDQDLVAQKIQETTSLSSFGISALKGFITTTTNIGTTIGLMLVFGFLMLLYRDRIKKFSVMITHENNQKHISTIVRKSFSVIPRYLAGLLTVIVIMTIISTLGFSIIGVPSPLFWGLIVSLLNIVPYIGPAIGFGAATIFSLLVVGPTTAIFAMIMFLIIQFIDNNFLTPLIAGSQVDINPLLAIISLIVWGMIWGAMGMVLALPILGLIKIICDEIPDLRPFGYLIGGEK